MKKNLFDLKLGNKMSPKKEKNVTISQERRCQSTTRRLFLQRGDQNRMIILKDVHSYKKKKIFTNPRKMGLRFTWFRYLNSALLIQSISRFLALSFRFSILCQLRSLHIKALYPPEQNKAIEVTA
jgi:hypothetical protein